MARTIVKGTNSYASTTDETSYLATIPSTDANKAAWTALADADKDAFHLQAVDSLNSLHWQGTYANLTSQVLTWPRSGVYDPITGVEYAYALVTDIPSWLAKAQCAEAYGRYCSAPATGSSTSRATLQAEGVVRFRLGDLEEEYNPKGGITGYAGGAIVSADAFALITRYLRKNFTWTATP